MSATRKIRRQPIAQVGFNGGFRTEAADVARTTPTMGGSRYSRATMAVWDKVPTELDTRAPW